MFSPRTARWKRRLTGGDFHFKFCGPTSGWPRRGAVSLPSLNPTAPIDWEQLVARVYDDVYEAVKWACLRYRGRVRWDELDDFSQQIILKLFEDDCRRLRSFNNSFSFKTWLQRVVDHDVYRWLRRRKQAESLDEIDLEEFGRTPMNEERKGSRFLGRDHHPRAFTMWMAGGGIKPGVTIGRTDELGYNVVGDAVEVHDLHATILHLMGLDHTRLTYRFQGRDFRLNDVSGNIVGKLMA
jgi:RNA polymerase sigma factor (sigma-70 family)